MNLPEWASNKIEELGAARQAGQITRQEAATALRDVILGQADETLIRAIFGEFAGKVLDSWHRAHMNGGLADGAQSDLFPELPLRLYVRPAVTKPLILCTGHDWDMARNVLENRTENAIKGAKDDWAQFEAAYDRVRPLLAGDATTADIAGQLRQPA